MDTEVVKVNPVAPERQAIERAAALIRAGDLVAFPTETVYGLGANALDREAVAKIFGAKGRPATNPLIVHVMDADSARQVVADWPESAQRLADHFWPGPLTLVLPKSERIPPGVTASGATVAVRAPKHPIAQALLEATSLPIAAPSANRSTRLSPTSAEHVLRSLGGRIPLLLDGGPSFGGLESTVVDLTTRPPRILRPGMVTAADIAEVIGPVEYEIGHHESTSRSPGLLRQHYAPRAPLAVASPPDDERLVREACAKGMRVGWMALTPGATDEDFAECVTGIYQMPTDARSYARRLYSSLHQLDDWGAEQIVAALPPDTEEWRAVRDRLYRAAVQDSAGK